MIQDHETASGARAAADLDSHNNAEANGYPAKPEQNSPPSAASLYDVCESLKERLDAFLAEETDDALLRKVKERLRSSTDLVEQSLKQYRLDQISISYNGGKDCLVMLVILLASIARLYPRPDEANRNPNTDSSPNAPYTPSASSVPPKLEAVYIVSAHPFPEIDTFVETSSADYHLNTRRFMLPMKEGLAEFLKEKPSIKSVFVGTRRTDPHGENLKPFDPTDDGWPSVMRLHSILDWRLVEIWTFIRHLKIPYCSLYDKGYTSLGGKLDTRPNPRLKQDDANKGEFRPAYELIEDNEERLGRDK